MTVNEIISELYTDVRIDRCIKNLSPFNNEDIKQELFTALLVKDGALIERLHTEGTLFFYAVAVAKNMVFAESRRKKTDPLFVDIAEEITDIDGLVRDSRRIDLLLCEFENLDKQFGTFYFRELIKAIARHGSQGKVATVTGIPKQTISVHVKRVRDYLEEKVC